MSYKKGDVVESEQDLAAAYVNKFKRLPDETEPTSPSGGEVKKLAVPETKNKSVAPPPEPPKEPEKKMVVKHFGGGRYDAVRVDTGTRVSSPGIWLTKEQAQEIAGA